MRKESGGETFIESEIESIASSDDVSLFRLLLTPSELAVLKLFLQELRPLNIREIYQLTLEIIFSNTFLKNISKHEPTMSFLKITEPIFVTLINAGYGEAGHIEARGKKAIVDSYADVIQTNQTPASQLANLQYKLLTKNNVKCPSYDRIKTIVESFVKRGLLNNKKEKNINYYNLNINFYNMVKDKIPAIIKI